MVWKMKLVIAIVVAVALQCAEGQVPTSIQLRFLAAMQNGDEALDGTTITDILLPIEIDLTPNTAILGDRITVTVSRTAGSATDTACGTPGAGDFCFVTNDVTFDIGANDLNTITVVLNVFDDLLVEGTESFTVSASITSPGTHPGGVVPVFVGGTDTVNGIIIDNDVAIFQFNPNTYTVAEDVAGGTQAVSLQLVSGILTFPIGILVQVTGGTATATADFSGPAPNVVTFLAGDGVGTSRNTIYTIVNDNILELTMPGETITMSGTSQNALGQFQAGGDTAVITILDDETIPLRVRLSSTVYNAAEGTPTVAVCVDADNPADIGARTISVNIVANPGTATGGGVDYGPITCNPLVFSGTDSQECCSIPINDDFLCEGTESFTVTVVAVDANANVVSPATASVFIADNDVKSVGTDLPSYTVTEFEDPQLNFDLLLNGPVTPGLGRSCVVTITAVTGSGTAMNGQDYDAAILPNPVVTFTFGSSGSMPRSINILDDLILEDTETFSLSLSTNSPDCIIPNPLVPVTILDDEDCTGRDGMPCDANAMCEELPGRDNFTCTCIPPYRGDGFMCTRVSGMGDDPHFSIVLPSGELLCYTVQGEHGFVFNLISNKKVQMNAMFVPDSRREEVTWLGSMGIIVQNSQYKRSNATYLRFEIKGKKIYIGDKVALEAKKIEKLIFVKGKLTISETPPFEGFRYPSVVVDLQDVGLNFTIKFMGEHLDLFWHNTGIHTQDSHGLIGQFFRKGVEVDTVRKILILPAKEPVPVMRRPVWSFMEREVVDDQLCWTAMNPGYQGEGLIDGNYFDYLMNDILSTDFKFKKRQ